jgi:purine-binding chemotaxis protein CheW
MDKNQDPPRTRGSIDWEDVRRRIAAAEASLAGLDEMSPEELQKVWARRAAQLAARPQQQDQDEQVELVLIQLGYELYGLDVQHVFDIKPLEQITRVPRVPNWVAGVVNLRGRILSVIDLRRLFGLSPAEPRHEQETEIATLGADGFLIVVQSPAMEVALLVDDVLTIEALPASQIQDASGTMRGLRPEYVRGVAERTGGDVALGGTLQIETMREKRDMLVVLDLPALLADARLVIHHVEII